MHRHPRSKPLLTESQLAATLGAFRETLGDIAESGPQAGDGFKTLRSQLVDDDRVVSLLPDFVIECRSPRDFWNYIQGAFGSYKERSEYITGQILPIERVFRPLRQSHSFLVPPEVRFVYSPVEPVSGSTDTFVSKEKINDLRRLPRGKHDLAKLIRMCEELNLTYLYNCYYSTAMLVRALLDHVPPIFDKQTFTEVANNIGGKSFKDSMLHLENTARKLADTQLHSQVSRREPLLGQHGVYFIADIDMLLAEIIRQLA